MRGAVQGWRRLSSAINPIDRIRNIGISAHIDSGKTTLTERILYYTGRIHEIHEVRGKDGVGAKMDSMELEREKGITIQSAATFTQWKDHHINIIDTPGHVDFTIEVERALRVLDGAILVVCSVGSVQSQTITVDRQMKRYNVPRIVFVNKLDRGGANPFRIVKDVRKKLGLTCAAVQIPIGTEHNHQGVVDLISGDAHYFEGPKGDTVVTKDMPAELKDLFEDKKAELIHTLADVDDEIAELFLMEETPSPEQLKAAIKRQTQALKFCPVFMGSAYKNKGVQTLLDGVIDYLPNPSQVSNFALDLNNDEEKIELMSDSKKSLVSLAFKLEKSKYGQLTYLRMYQGSLSRGSQIVGNIEGQSRKFKVPRLVRMHSNEMEDIEKVGPGEIVAMFGVDCPSGTTFTDGSVNYSMTSMFIPDPVVSLAVAPKMSKDLDKFGKALRRFIQEDPTFRMYFDADTNENIVSGMGELHLQIYCERMLREYGVEVKVGAPKVRYQEAISSQAPFDYLLKKQTGGQGQFGRVIGYIEPLPAESKETFVFDNQLRGENIPPQFHISCEKGFKAAAEKGALTGNPVVGVRVVLLDGASHPVDSSDLAFQSASQYAFRQAFMNARPILLQPVMTVEVETPIEFQGEVVSGLTKRKATIKATSAEADVCTIVADVPLADMFGYSSILRSMTEGKGTFSMEYLEHQPMVKQDMDRVVNEYKSTLKAED